MTNEQRNKEILDSLKERRKNITKEQALQDLVDAGILNSDGSFTDYYKESFNDK